MLSGYPVATMVQFDVFVRQALETIQGIQRELPVVTLKAGKKIPSSLGRTDYIRAKTHVKKHFNLISQFKSTFCYFVCNICVL